MNKKNADSHRLRGNFGEVQVCRRYEQNGYTILKRNFRVKGGEIDIIAVNDEFLCFVEVKTRQLFTISAGMNGIDKRKQSHIIRAAERFLEDYEDVRQIRFDAAEVVITNSDRPDLVEINIYENAFDASE
jgi:putative endonuclease